MSGSASGEREREWSHTALCWEAYIYVGGVVPRVLSVEKVCTKKIIVSYTALPAEHNDSCEFISSHGALFLAVCSVKMNYI